MKDPVIIFEKVSKSYPLYHNLMGIKRFLFSFTKSLRAFKNSRFEALRDISFEVYRGETFGIIGRNGAGKSTILGLIAGVLKPTQGKVLVRGRIASLLELGGGFHWELTGRENIMLNGILLGLTREEVRKKMDAIIEFSELGEFIDQPIRVYSSGMLARLGFSVVAHLDPEILLVDEILTVGDINFQRKCLEKMLNFKKNGTTIVFVSHSMEDIKRLCDRVMWIENHNIKMIGEPEEVVSNYIKFVNS
ncbi:MAG: ABC transporter ATP-binding protein [Thermodesulfobacterium sp.]|nr:ABC transporter ATP-binding protein [Thermodesulfobacterium sp.]